MEGTTDRRAFFARLATLALAAGIWFCPHPEGVTTPAWHLFAIFAAAIVSVVVGASGGLASRRSTVHELAWLLPTAIAHSPRTSSGFGYCPPVSQCGWLPSMNSTSISSIPSTP